MADPPGLEEGDIETVEAGADHRLRPSAAASRPSLLLYHRDGIEPVVLREGRPLTIGRARPSHVIVRERQLSRQHCEIELRDGEVRVTDLGSRNGTWINGERLVADARADHRRLGPGDVLQLGRAVSGSLHLVEPSPRREAPNLVTTHEQFRLELQIELERARATGRSTALIMLRSPQQPALGRWLPLVRQRLRPFDRISLYSPDTATLALPESDLQRASRVAHALIRAADDSEHPLVCGVASCPQCASSADELIERGQQALWLATVRQPLRCAPVAHRHTATDKTATEGPIIASEALRATYADVEPLARSRLPILLIGETGSGKEVLAEAIHAASRRAGRPMHAVNCGAIPAALIESTLFGHERGAFTGATEAVTGVFEIAHESTLLLDEVGELPLPAQVALLRALEARRIRRVGGADAIEVDVRVIAATNRDLGALARSGQFREDLYYRLNGVTLRVPPLRERLEEIPALTERFIRQANQLHGCEVSGCDARALEVLTQHDWPGNVRELRNVVFRAVVLAGRGRIALDDLPAPLRSLAGLIEADAPSPHRSASGELRGAFTTAGPVPADERPSSDGAATPRPFKQRMRGFEDALIALALHRAGGSVREAARLLRMPERTLFSRARSIPRADRGAVAAQARSDLAQLARLEQRWFGQPASDPLASPLELRERIARLEAALIREALERSDHNQSRAARELGMPVSTLVHKRRQHGL